jgi:hypothetical protein
MKTCAVLIIKPTYYHCFRWWCSLLMFLWKPWGIRRMVQFILFLACCMSVVCFICIVLLAQLNTTLAEDRLMCWCTADVLFIQMWSWTFVVSWNLFAEWKSPLHGHNLTSLLDISTWILHLLTVTCNQSITMHIRTRSSLSEQCHHLFSFFKML